MNTHCLNNSTFIEFLRWLMLCEGGVKTPQELSADALREVFDAQRQRTFVCDKDDRGGATLCGLTLTLLRQYNNHADVRVLKALPFDDWATIIAHEFWLPLRCDKMPAALAMAVADFGVNSGRTRAARILQQSINELCGRCLSEDGKVGTLTLTTLQRLDTSRQRQLLGIYTRRRKEFIQRCVKAGRIHRKFERGLMRRMEQCAKFRVSFADFCRD